MNSIVEYFRSVYQYVIKLRDKQGALAWSVNFTIRIHFINQELLMYLNIQIQNHCVYVTEYAEECKMQDLKIVISVCLQ